MAKGLNQSSHRANPYENFHDTFTSDTVLRQEYQKNPGRPTPRHSHKMNDSNPDQIDMNYAEACGSLDADHTRPTDIDPLKSKT